MNGAWIAIVLMSAVKYAVGVGTALASLDAYTGFVLTSVGGILGAIIFVYGGGFLEHWVFRHFRKKGKPRRIFTRKNRILVQMRNRGGLVLIAFISPIFISIPVGSLVAASFIKNKLKIVIYMSLSVLVWGVFIFMIKHHI
jgi:hypothetical protein